MSQFINKEINDLLKQLLLQIKTILADQFVGLYIGGSIANECFDTDTSDIDCYVITKNVLSENIKDEIEKMHKHFYLNSQPYAKKIEASYIPQNDLFNFDSNNTRPYFNEGNFYLGHYGNNFIIELFLLRKKGININGPDIKSLIPEISSNDLKVAIKKNLSEYWEKMLHDKKMEKTDYQIFAIFTMCRTLYSLEIGIIASKITAANWAINKLENKYKSLIERAITWKPTQKLNLFEETQEFVRYVIMKSDEIN